jgi:CRISPR-associated endonuclease/helicase Cas3
VSLSPVDFDAFFAAAHGGARPFAWQQRLLATILATGRWPERIVAPTGAGKTAVIDVHVFAVALMAAGAAPRVPRRLSLVVDRRALVDSQYDLARALLAALRAAPKGELLAEARELLRSLRSSRDADPLIVALLRGGVPASRRWVDDPTAAAILCATPAMWGSRLLFRGYGTSHGARPREAGLLAYDAVIVVDEAHLARQLVATARRVDPLEGMASSPLAVPRLQVVESSATQAAAPEGRAVGVEEGDLDAAAPGGAVLAARLRTAKPLALVGVPGWPATGAAARAALARRFADEAEALLERYGRTVACVANTVAAALGAATELRRRGRTVELLVGRLRPHDVAELRTRRPGLLAIEGNPDVDVVVATQTIEVGIDADFAAMVTELAPGAAIAQRAGRVNRLGRRASSEVRVLVPLEPLGPKGAPPYQADELAASLVWLRRRAGTSEGLAPAAISSDPPPPAGLPRLVLGRPEVGDVRFLARTSERLFAEPDLELWLADDLARDTDVAVVVRTGLGRGAGADLALLRATPPRDPEAFPAAIGAVRDLLTRDAEIAAHAYRWRAGELDVLEAADLRPGDLVAIDERAEWFTHGVVDPDGRERVPDVLEDVGAPLVLRIGLGMPLDAATRGLLVRRLLERVGGTLVAEPADGRARRAAIAAALAEAAEQAARSGLADAADRLGQAAALLRRRLADAALTVGPLDAEGVPAWVVVADQRRQLGDEEIRQTWTASTVPVSLAEHQARVAARAREIAARLDLGATTVATLEAAGAFHDEGKRDPRFQRLLGADPTDHMGPFAKSGGRTPAEYRAAATASGLPTGWRHEQLSAVAARAAEGLPAGCEADLVVRLVGTSHGQGRTSFPHPTARLLPDGHPLGPTSVALHDRGEWDHLVEATHRAHGFWGCAYLEALLRAADGQVSGEIDGRS